MIQYMKYRTTKLGLGRERPKASRELDLALVSSAA